MAAPKRDLFKAAEVCEVAEVQAYVLRSWEAEFPQLGQPPSGGGPRLYRRADIEMVLRIKSLVFGEGLTLAGARRRLDETAGSNEPQRSPRRGSARQARARSRAGGARRPAGDPADAVVAEAESELVLAAPAAAKRAGKSKRRAELGVAARGTLARAVSLSGCSAAWLARLLGVQEVPGSNPGIPTILMARFADRLPTGLVPPPPAVRTISG